MRLKTLRSTAGFTYIGALVMVVIIGIVAGRTAVLWKMKMQREKEVELLFRGTQYRDALRDFYGMSQEPYGVAPTQPGAPQTAAKPVTIPQNAPRLNELKDLLQSTTSAGKKAFLRRLYLDPITGKEFEAVVDKTNNRIVGVRSTSELEPIKKRNFPYELMPDDFEDKKQYKDWEFRCDRYPKPGASGTIKVPKKFGE